MYKRQVIKQLSVSRVDGLLVPLRSLSPSSKRRYRTPCQCLLFTIVTTHSAMWKASCCNCPGVLHGQLTAMQFLRISYWLTFSAPNPPSHHTNHRCRLNLERDISPGHLLADNSTCRHFPVHSVYCAPCHYHFFSFMANKDNILAIKI